MQTQHQDSVTAILDRDRTYQVNMSAMLAGQRNGIVETQRVGTVQSWLTASALRKRGLALRDGIVVTMFRRVK